MKVLCKNTVRPFKKGEYYNIDKDSPASCIVFLVENFGYRFFYLNYLDPEDIIGYNIFDNFFMTEKEIRKEKLKKLQFK